MITAVEQQVLVKVCGMTHEEDVAVALSGGVDLIGLIFAKSPRSVTPDIATKLVKIVRKYGERENRIGFKKEMAALLR